MLLVEEFGHRTAYFIMASGFAAVGVIAGAVVKAKENQEETVDEMLAEKDTAEVVTASAAQAVTQVPAAMAGLLFSSPAGPAILRGAGRLTVRNWPLVLMLTAIGILMWSRSTDRGDDRHRWADNHHAKT